ncbi:MAG: chromate transporter [Oscillospiraceae bacterium]
MIYFMLFWEFFKTGLFAIGGGLATLPFLYDMSDKTGWFTHAQLADMIAVSESTPGPIGVNMATYVGFSTCGILGSIVATIGLITPSIIVILIIAKFLEAFRGNKLVKSAFYGLRPASTALIAVAFVTVAKISLFNFDLFAKSGLFADMFNIKNIILAVLIFVMTRRFKKIHPAVFLLGSGVIGIVLGQLGI